MGPSSVFTVATNSALYKSTNPQIQPTLKPSDFSGSLQREVAVGQPRASDEAWRCSLMIFNIGTPKTDPNRPVVDLM